MAVRIAKPATAFALSSGKKRPRQQTGDFLNFVRGLPCVVCHTRAGIEAAHIRYTYLPAGKPQTGLGTKPDDRWTVPLCHGHHAAQHTVSEVGWWASLGIDPIYIAALLFSHFHAGDYLGAETVIANATLLGRHR